MNKILLAMIGTITLASLGESRYNAYKLDVKLAEGAAKDIRFLKRISLHQESYTLDNLTYMTGHSTNNLCSVIEIDPDDAITNLDEELFRQKISDHSYCDPEEAKGLCGSDNPAELYIQTDGSVKITVYMPDIVRLHGVEKRIIPSELFSYDYNSDTKILTIISKWPE